VTSLILVLISTVLAADEAGPVLRPEAVEALFVEPARPATIRWRADRDLPSDSLAYTLRDFQDREVGTGTTQRLDPRTVAVQLTLAQGYYELELSGVATRFGLVALPASAQPPHPFFCIDSAISWLVRDDDLRPGLVRILRRSGMAMSRERLSWGEIQPVRERFDWNGHSGYETVRQLHAGQQVPVLEMFHSATPWSGTVGKYPEDLLGTAAAWREITRRWRSTWGGLEIWNEPDIFFGDLLPADQYVALVKTLAWAVNHEAPDMTLVGGVMAHYHRPFLDTAAEGGMLDCVDVASFHTYDRAARMQELVGKYRDWLAAHGRPDMPLWITESGRPWKKGPSRPPADQDAASALDITRKAIEVRACGVARYFAFVYPFYEENENNFGMLDRWGTPLRSFAAYAQAARALGGKQYLGDLCLGESAPAARVFGDQHEAVAVLTAAAGTSQTAVVGDLPVRRAEALDGRKIEVSGAGEVPLSDGLAYVWFDRAAVAQRLDTQTEAMRLWKLGQTPPPRRQSPSPIVLRWQIDPAALKPETAGYRVVGEAPGKARLAIRAFNLGEQPAEFRLVLDAGEAPVRISGENSRAVRVPAAGFAEADWEVDLSEAFALSDHIKIVVRPTGDVPERTLPLAVSLIGQPTIAQQLARYAQRVRLPFGEAARWQPNIPSHGRLDLKPQPDNSVSFSARFTNGDRWVYPSFQLPDELDVSRFSALVLRARCERPAAVRVFLWEGDRGVGYLTATSIIPADGQWHAAEVRFDELTLSSANAPDDNDRLDLGQVRRIAIGMNSDMPDNRLEISEAYLVGPRVETK
jgi:hypothetical protein